MLELHGVVAAGERGTATAKSNVKAKVLAALLIRRSKFGCMALAVGVSVVAFTLGAAEGAEIMSISRHVLGRRVLQ